MSEVFRTPDERFAGLEGYDFEPNYIDLTGDLDGLRMHYVDEGEGSPILLLHGEPTWSYLYRKMIPGLTGSGPGRGSRLHRLRSLGQGDRDGLVHVRPPCRFGEAIHRGARPPRHHARGARYGAGRSGCAWRWRTRIGSPAS